MQFVEIIIKHHPNDSAMKSTMHLLKNTARMLAIIDRSTPSIIHLMNVWVESHQTFLGSGEVLGVRHLGSKLSILLQEISEGEKDDWDNLSSRASRERQEILEVQAQGNKRNSCHLLNKRQSSIRKENNGNHLFELSTTSWSAWICPAVSIFLLLISRYWPRTSLRKTLSLLHNNTSCHKTEANVVQVEGTGRKFHPNKKGTETLISLPLRVKQYSKTPWPRHFLFLPTVVFF